MKKKKDKYDPEMPCNKKKCDDLTRASCCGCPDWYKWHEAQKKKDKKDK